MRLSRALLKMASSYKPPRLSLPVALPLDTRLFDLPVKLPALTLPAKQVGKALGVAKKFQLQAPKVQPVQDCEAKPGHRTILLDGTKVGEAERAEMTGKLEKIGGLEWAWEERELRLGFENFHADDLVRAALPPEIPWQKAFSRVGHIVHLNLRREQEPHRFLIGQIFLLKNKAWARTVIAKAANVSSEFRTLSMELLAGEEDFATTVAENGATFHLDFRKVFWNPRQGTERARVIGRLLAKPSCQLYDLFAGVGPFAVPAAKGGCRVLANDLNPDCVEFLRRNVELNKCGGNVVSTHTLDAKAFLTEVVGPDLASLAASPSPPPEAHCVMNLPGMAVDFLPAFRGCLPSDGDETDLPFPLIVHCYTFSHGEAKGSEEEESTMGKRRRAVETEAADRVAAAFPGYDSPEDFEIVESRECRHVAPAKFMVCVSVRLSARLLRGQPSANGRSNADPTEPKRPRRDGETE